MLFVAANSRRCALASSARSNSALARSKPSSVSSSSAPARWPVPSWPPLRPDAPSPKRCASISATLVPAFAPDAYAAESPVKPPPTMTTSTVEIAVERRIVRPVGPAVCFVPGVTRRDRAIGMSCITRSEAEIHVPTGEITSMKVSNSPRLIAGIGRDERVAEHLAQILVRSRTGRRLRAGRAAGRSRPRWPLPVIGCVRLELLGDADQAAGERGGERQIGIGVGRGDAVLDAPRGRVRARHAEGRGAVVVAPVVVDRRGRCLASAGDRNSHRAPTSPARSAHASACRR